MNTNIWTDYYIYNPPEVLADGSLLYGARTPREGIKDIVIKTFK